MPKYLIRRLGIETVTIFLLEEVSGLSVYELSKKNTYVGYVWVAQSDYAAAYFTGNYPRMTNVDMSPEIKGLTKDKALHKVLNKLRTIYG